MPELPLVGDARPFQVDLRGLVDLLSHHLYSSPRVYVRELLQNAVDAVTARRAMDQAAPTAITIQVHEDGGLSVTDPGIGLTEQEAHRFLATIGDSSKRDDLAGARQEFLGQFGIGLLSCFAVASQVCVVTRSAVGSGSPVEWLATADGTYRVRTLDDEMPGNSVGSTVRLTPRPGAEGWFEPRRVADLARDYGSLLPYPVTVSAPGAASVTVTEGPPAWEREYPSDAARRSALAAHCREALGFDPLDIIELNLPVAGIRGAAYVLPKAVSPADSGRHRVYLKGMLLSDAATGLLPEWAFFVRCVIDTDTLKPTASREALYEDETLAAVREALGSRIRNWLTGLAAEDPARLDTFLSVHSLGVKALARHDLELLRIMLPYLKFESPAGPVTLTEFTKTYQQVYVAPAVDEFRQVAPIAAAQGLGVLNGGYTYDSELINLLPRVFTTVTVAELDASQVTAALDTVDPAAELELSRFLAVARATLDSLDCDVILREFHPVSVSALLLDSRAARTERARAETAAEADELWTELLGALKASSARTQLVLNHHSPIVRSVARIADGALLSVAVESLYGQALLMARRPLRAADSALLNRAFRELLAIAARSENTRGEDL
jgi:molecular chaperone HtpG